MDEKQITQQEMISDIKRVATKLNKEFLLLLEYKQHGTFSMKDIVNSFGSWRKAYIAAGLKNPRTREFTIEEIIEDIKRVDQLVNMEWLTLTKYETLGKYKRGNIIKVMGNWTNAIKGAEIKSRITTNEQFINDLNEVAVKLNTKTFSQKDYTANSKIYGHFSISVKFGSWKNALKQAGLTPMHRGRKRREDSLFLNDLVAVAALLKIQSLSWTAYKNNSGKFEKQTFVSKFGSWNKAIEKAGLTTLKMGSQIKYTPEELLNDIRLVKAKLNKDYFTFLEYKKNNGKYSDGTFSSRFESWKNSLKLASE